MTDKPMSDKVTLDGELMFPRDYLNAVEFKGKDVPLTITHVGFEELRVKGKQPKTKPVLTFKETKKKLVCNVTNADSIRHVLQLSEATEWVGHRIVLYPTRVKFGREMKDAIRVRETAPTQRQSAETAEGNGTTHMSADDAADIVKGWK